MEERVRRFERNLRVINLARQRCTGTDTTSEPIARLASTERTFLRMHVWRNASCIARDGLETNCPMATVPPLPHRAIYRGRRSDPRSADVPRRCLFRERFEESGGERRRNNAEKKWEWTRKFREFRKGRGIWNKMENFIDPVAFCPEFLSYFTFTVGNFDFNGTRVNTLLQNASFLRVSVSRVQPLSWCTTRVIYTKYFARTNIFVIFSLQEEFFFSNEIRLDNWLET